MKATRTLLSAEAFLAEAHFIHSMAQVCVQTSRRVATPKAFWFPPVLFYPPSVFWLLICVLERISTPPAPSLHLPNTDRDLLFGLAFVWAIFRWSLKSLLAPCDLLPHLSVFFCSHPRRAGPSSFHRPALHNRTI